MILFDVVLEAGDGARDRFVALLDRTMSASQHEEGCLIYRFTCDLSEPSRFYLIELWQDEAALIAHAKGEAFRGFLADLPSCGRVVSSTARTGALDPYTFKRPQ
jgi:quinol monooxygenase YgiN